MKPKKVIQALQDNIQYYSPFWYEWIKQPACSLTHEDLYIIDVHSKNNFTISVFESFMFYNQNKRLQQLNAKLTADQLKFREWIIEEFLFFLVNLCGNQKNKYDRPFWEFLKPEDIRASLLSFHVFTIQGFFITYKEQDLWTENVFSKILSTQEKVIKSKLLTQKSICL